MFAGLGGWHVLVIIVIVLLLFGATRLPALARSVGQSARILKKEIRETPPTPDSGVEIATGDQGSVESARPVAPRT